MNSVGRYFLIAAISMAVTACQTNDTCHPASNFAGNAETRIALEEWTRKEIFNKHATNKFETNFGRPAPGVAVDGLKPPLNLSALGPGAQVRLIIDADERVQAVYVGAYSRSGVIVARSTEEAAVLSRRYTMKHVAGLTYVYCANES